MKKTLILTVAIVFGLALMLGGAPADVQAKTTFVTIGTGGITGVYYPTGGAIAKMVNAKRDVYGIRATVEATGGSAFNINAVMAGDLEFGVAQSDRQFQAFNGTEGSEWAGKPQPDLRAVFSIHAETVDLIASVDSGINSIQDLKGKRVNIGNPGSGQRGTMEVLMAAKGMSKDDFSLVSELKSAEQSKALCDNKIDAMVFTVGHPSGSIKEATTSCDAVLVAVNGPAVDKLVADNEYYRKATIPGGMYRGTPDDTATFGVGATFVSSTNTPADTVYAVVKSVFENFDSFRKLHPAFANLKKEEMIKDGLSAPLHDGAVRYYKEAGLM